VIRTALFLTLGFVRTAVAQSSSNAAGADVQSDVRLSSFGNARIAGGSDLQFCQIQKLMADDAMTRDAFGSFVSISGDVVLVAANGREYNGVHSGTVYVFRRNGSDWVQEQKLFHDGEPSEDYFGHFVSVSGDVALVGAYGDDEHGLDSGAAYVFRWNGSAWVQEQKLLPDDGAAEDHFGRVAVSGDVALVAATGDDDNGSDSGAAYVFRWNGSAWVQEQKLLPDDGAAEDYFGSHVSVSGDVAFVAATGADDSGLDSGAAYVFRYNGSTWVQEQKLLAGDGTEYDHFGGFVSVDGDVGFVGAANAGFDGSSGGSVYAFRWNGSIWAQEQKLVPEDDILPLFFGTSMSLSGNAALIGAYSSENGPLSGSAYVFRWNGSGWLQTQKILPADGAELDQFGLSVSLSGDVGVVGARLDDDNSLLDSGAAYLFYAGGPDCNDNGIPDRCDIASGTNRDSDGDGTLDICTDYCEAAKLQPDDTPAYLDGWTVSVSGDVTLLGAEEDDPNGLYSGSAYVFRWNGAVWKQEQKLIPDDGADDDHFGNTVSVSGNVALIGAYRNNDYGESSGSAYVYRWNGTAWFQEQKLIPYLGAAGDFFGCSVSISGDVALVGAYGNDINGSDSGSAYVFRWNGTAWILERQLFPDDGAADDRFGRSVSLSGDVALISGVSRIVTNGPFSSLVYVFRWNGSTWIQEQKLIPDDDPYLGVFGNAVSVTDDVALVGASFDDDNGPLSGSAYVFRWNGSAWVQEQKLLAEDGAEQNGFGSSVSVSSGVALIGASNDDDNGFSSGSAYVFGWDGTDWVQQQKLLPRDGTDLAYFGVRVSISGQTALVGDLMPGGPDAIRPSARVFSIGVTDCNQNDVFDACDIRAETSGDCDGNGVPDDCEVPQTGAVVSEWLGGTGLWDDPPGHLGWCLPETPDNYILDGVTTTFEVLIDGPEAVVVLNTSPTVSSLTLSNGATLLANDDSGAHVRTLAVDGTIVNGGIFRATDRERLVLDAITIDQGGECGSGGVLEATDGILGAGEDDETSVLEINGAVVIGGTARTEGDHSEIHLIGGAELVNVCVDGVVVPDGQTAAFSGTVTNDDVLTIRGVTANTQLGPTTTDAVLDSSTETGRVALTSQMHARLGDFKSAFTNAAKHKIVGAGVIFGGMTNEGLVNADLAGEELIVFPPGGKTNNGTFKASNGGMLRLSASVNGTGSYSAEGGTIRVRPDGRQASLRGRTLEILHGDHGQPGTFEVAENATVEFTETVVIGPGGTYQPDPTQLSGPVAASLTAGSLTILPGQSPGELGGTLILAESMSATILGDVVMDGTGALPCDSVAGVSTASVGGQTPPIKSIRGSARLAVAGDLSLIDSVDVGHSSSAAMTLGGDFNNHSRFPQCFDWESGGLSLNGSAVQVFEVAGRDMGASVHGFDSNFAMGTVEVAAHGRVQFADTFDNDGAGGTECTEALYVHELILHDGAEITISGCRVYFDTLVDQGANIALNGCGQLVQLPAGDADGNGKVDLSDWQAFVACFLGPSSVAMAPACSVFDFDADQNVDLSDLNRFLQRYTGS